MRGGDDDELLQQAIGAVPGGALAVGVSGGADSVALLELLRQRSDLSLHVVHLDHETRGCESARDAEFVREVAASWKLPCTIAKRNEIESSLAAAAAPAAADLPANRSSRFRSLRLELFRRVVAEHALAGVILAHHADDQAETVMQRLLRGSGAAGLTGMSPRTVIGGLTILRPLLGVPREMLRTILRNRGVGWREDSSNASPAQQRNRVRRVLSRSPALTDAMIELAGACDALMRWLREQGPELGEKFDVAAVADLPPPVAREALRRWLARRAGADVEIAPAAVERLAAMATDAATSPRQHFPGGLFVRRRGGVIFVDS